MHAHFHPMHASLTDTDAGRAALNEYQAARAAGQSHDQAEMVAGNVLQRAGFNVNARGGVTIVTDELDFQTMSDERSTHSVEDGQVRYFVEAAGLPLQEIADAFMLGYDIAPDADDGQPVAFRIEDMTGATLGAFKGRPDQQATRG